MESRFVKKVSGLKIGRWYYCKNRGAWRGPMRWTIEGGFAFPEWTNFDCIGSKTNFGICHIDSVYPDKDWGYWESYYEEFDPKVHIDIDLQGNVWACDEPYDYEEIK